MINNSSQQNQSKTLWIGDIESWMDEKFLLKVFSELTTVKNVKIMRDKNTGLTQGYGFVEFDSPEIARTIMTNLNGKSIAGTNKLFKLNWATHGAGKSNTYNNTVTNTALYNYQGNNNINGLQDYSIYVADIDPNVSEEILKEFFMKLYPSVISSKEIIVDPITKLSKGYGFIKFKDYNESQRAINEMNGKIFFSKPLKTNQAAWKKLTQENNTNNLNSNYSALFTTGNNNNYYQKSNINSKVYPQGYSGADPNTVYGGYDMNQVMMMYGQSNINNNAYQNYPINCSYQIQNTTPNLSTTSSNNNINTNQANNSININQYLQYQQQQMYLQSLYHQNYNNIPNTNTNNKMSGYNSNNNNLSTNSQILNPSNVNSTNNIPNLTNQQLLTYLSTVGNNSFSTGTNSLNTNTSSSTNSNQSSTQNTTKNEGSSTDNSKNVKNDKKEDKDEIKSEGSLSSPDSNSPTDNQLKNVGNINNNLDEKSLTTK